MTRVRFSWAACRAALGRSGLAGVALMLAALAFFATAVQQRQVDAQRLQEQTDVLQERHGKPRAHPDGAATPEEELRAFIEYFPPAATLQDWIERIQLAGAASGVNVERADYKLASEQAAGLTRYQITLPVKGTYAEIRSFVASLLEVVPTLALVDIDLKRDAIGAAAVEARLTLSLFLRGGPQR